MRKFLPIILIFAFISSGCESWARILSDLLYSPIQKGVEHTNPDAAYNGYFFVVWGSGDIFGRKIQDDGQFLSGIFSIVEDETLQLNPRITTLSDTFIVTFVDHRTRHGWVYYKKISKSSTPVPGPGIKLDDVVGVDYLDIEASTNVAVYSAKNEEYTRSSYLTFYSPTMDFLHSTCIGDYMASSKLVASYNNFFGALTRDRLIIYGVDGDYLKSLSLPDGIKYCIAGGSDGWGILYTKPLHTPSGNALLPRFAIFDTSGMKEPPGEVSLYYTTGIFVYDIALSYDSIYLAVWTIGSNIYALRVSNDGNILDEGPILVASNYDVRNLKAVAGHNFLILWDCQEGGVFGRVMGKDGFMVSDVLKISP